MIRFIPLALFLTVSFTCGAQSITVYKCVIKGVPTFSQTPCAKDPQAITLEEPNVIESKTNNSSNDNLTDRSVDDYLEIQKIDRSIKKLKLSIKQYKKEYAEKKQQINYITQDKANRLGASSIADAIATKTASLKQSYEPAIKNAQKQIELLEQKKVKINSN